MKKVNWSSYAEVYDLILECNPAYQDIVTQFLNKITHLDIPPDDAILDIGAGTGNFTLTAARVFSKNNIFYLDADHQMTRAAQVKTHAENLTNIQFISETIEKFDWSKALNLKMIICVHALYTIKNPHQLLQIIYDHLQPGGYIFLCDLGRVLNIFDWSKYFVRHLLKRQGLLSTIKFLWKGRKILEQNRIIRQLQLNGTYWTHSHEEFCDAVKATGFKILSAEKVFCGYSDLIMGIKPISA